MKPICLEQNTCQIPRNAVPCKYKSIWKLKRKEEGRRRRKKQNWITKVYNFTNGDNGCLVH